MPCGAHKKQSVTDRAHRYRAQKCAPAGPRRCRLCGSRRFLVVDHKDGDEHNDRRSNLRWLCKSCNNAEGARMIRKGKGRRTRQYNASANRGARHYGEYINAILGHEPGAHDRGGKMIHETPKHLRSEFAEKIWRRRRMRGNKKNPVVESIVGGLAAGTAVVLASEYLKPLLKKNPGLPKTVRRRGKANPYIMEKRDGRPVGGPFVLNANDVENLRYSSIGDGYTYQLINTTTRKRFTIKGGKITGPGAPNPAPAANRRGAMGLLGPDDLIRSRNAADAEQMFTEFHGRGPAEVLDMQDKILRAGDYAALGDDPEIWLVPVEGDPQDWPTPSIRFMPRDRVKLAVDASGGQLYFVGDNQRLPLSDLEAGGLDTSKRFITMGPAYGISYKTEKVFDRFKPTVYAHRLGEETGELPTLIYDKETKRLILAGGAYNIAPPDRELKASPGIVN